MQAAIAERLFGGRQLSFHIGINSGPVVAGIIGRKKFIYDLWGEAVNLASRIESHGRSRSIQITRNTYELIKDAFDCETIGRVDVKGAGSMEVWHVIGEKAHRCIASQRRRHQSSGIRRGGPPFGRRFGRTGETPVEFLPSSTRLRSA